MRTVWIYSHIPKSGGTTMKAVLENGFGSEFKDDVSLLYHKFHYSHEQLRAIFDGNPMVRCIAGHRFNALMPEIPDLSTVVLTQIRDPADRFLSHYFFFRRHRSQNFWPEVKTLSLCDYFEWAIVDGNAPELANFQTWFLTGHTNEEGLHLAEDRICSRQLLAFPLSRFDEALIWLSKTHPQTFSDCSYTRKNVRYRASEEDHQADALEVRSAIQEYAQVDYRLLALADTQLNHLMSEAFGSSHQIQLELETLRRRNRLVERSERWKGRLNRVKSRMFG